MTKRVFPCAAAGVGAGVRVCDDTEAPSPNSRRGFWFFLSSSKRFVHYENVSSSDRKQETPDSKDAGRCLNKQGADTGPASAHFRHLNALLMPVFLSAAAVEVR